MLQTNHPCTRDCSNRNAECHSVCEKWLIYEKKHKEELLEKDRARQTKDDYIRYKTKQMSKNKPKRKFKF